MSAHSLRCPSANVESMENITADCIARNNRLPKIALMSGIYSAPTDNLIAVWSSLAKDSFDIVIVAPSSDDHVRRDKNVAERYKMPCKVRIGCLRLAYEMPRSSPSIKLPDCLMTMAGDSINSRLHHIIISMYCICRNYSEMTWHTHRTNKTEKSAISFQVQETFVDHTRRCKPICTDHAWTPNVQADLGANDFMDGILKGVVR